MVVIISLLPSLFWLWYFYKKDKYEPEPIKMIVKIFLLGCLSTVFAAFGNETLIKISINSNFFANNSPLKTSFIMYFLIIGPVEEIVKFLVIKLFVFNDKNFNEIMDGIIYGITVALGFAFIENILYFYKFANYSGRFINPAQFQEGVFTICVRAVTANIAHAIFTGIMGYYIGIARFSVEKSKKYLISGVIYAIFIHGLYDFTITIFPSMQYYVAIGMVLVTYGFLAQKIKLSLSMSPFRKKDSENLTVIPTSMDAVTVRKDRICPKCGYRNPIRMKFCQICKTYIR
ncbi:PrsW family intramembrane metalloprotease [bacterium]|nr:PrsW family intramembrane metalloprotease [bacterium]